MHRAEDLPGKPSAVRSKIHHFRRMREDFSIEANRFVSEKNCRGWYKTRMNDVGSTSGAESAWPVSLGFPCRVCRNSRPPWGVQQLEQELQAKLDEPRICPRRCSCDHAKVDVVGGTTDGIRGRKLCSVEHVEELDTELHAEALIRGEPGSLE